MKKDRVILFDLGRVLFDFDHLIAARKISKDCSLSEKEIYDLFFDSQLTDKYERGVVTSFDFYKEVKKILDIDIDYEGFIPIWNDIFFPVPGMLEVIESLKVRYPIYLASNTNELHFLHLEEQFPEYFRCFRYLFLSHQLGLRKPDPLIYNFIISYIKTDPGNIIYIDDRKELVEPAKNLGIDAFVFHSVDSMKEELAKRNILV
ncbi:HAD family hydrolase [Thermoproteota archaeon]